MGGFFMWKQKVKKIGATIIILVLLPFVITVFLSGNQKAQKVDVLDQYCISVLAQEVTEKYEKEMLKAQAVLVRTTVYKEIQENEGNLDVEKGYQIEKTLGNEWYKRLKSVWDETDGQVLLYKEKLALTPFHNLSNGNTRNGKEVLGSEEYPYLQSVSCPKDVESDKQLNSKIINVSNAKITKTDNAGYVMQVQVGEETVSGEQFRDTYGLASGSFFFQEAGEKMRVITSGIGHGLGLSQNTANEMAKEGNTYQEILSYFFPETTIKEVAQVLIKTE